MKKPNNMRKLVAVVTGSRADYGLLNFLMGWQKNFNEFNCNWRPFKLYLINKMNYKINKNTKENNLNIQDKAL